MVQKEKFYRILMVCLGNICRSPLAEGIMQYELDKAGIQAFVDSAGTGSYHLGSPPHPQSQKIAQKHGIDISCQKARLLQKEDFEHFDLIFFMDQDNLEEGSRIAGKMLNPEKCFLLLGHDSNGTPIEVPDPYYGGYSGYEAVFRMVSTACQEIAKNLRNFDRPLL